jgi:hypothetical protein
VGVVHHLVTASADVDAENNDGATALMLATYAQKEHVVRSLLAHGARQGLAAALAFADVRPVGDLLDVGRTTRLLRLDLAEVLVAAASTDSGLGKTFEVYYRDTAQPVDMYASLKSCKELGKSVKECFFGEGYDESTPVSLDEVMKSPLKGTLFASGSEVQGNSYTDMLSRLQPDNQKAFDLSSLAADNVM